VKPIFIAAILITATPSHAFEAYGCSGAVSGFIKVGNQVKCIRQLSPEELEAALEAAQAKAYRRQHKRAVSEAEARKRRAERRMDIAGDNILQPNGRRNYRRALDNYTDASVDLMRLTQ